MSNTIELAKSFVPKLDECYRLASLTSVLDGAPELAKQGANANELIIPMMSMDGLADYSRNGGYVQGGVTMTNETVKCNFDRGRRFDVDVMDDLETAGLAFGRLSAQFIRDKVVPELDAFRFASYCGISGVTKKEETLADGAATVAALSAAVTAMDDEEVTATGRYLFITPTLLQGINSCRRCGYLHWWEFLGAFHGIGDGLFAQVVNIRNKRARGKMLDKSEQEFARENAAVIKIHAAESVEDKAEKERLLDLLGR